jgi:lysophospholipase L1-like esterase
MKKELLLVTCLLLIPMFTKCQVKEGDLKDQSEIPATIVILGSSTAAGTGPKDIANAWVNRYIAYVEDINHDHRVINLAKGSYTTYHMMPRGYVPPEGRPRPDPGRCITQALLLDPSAIIINLPSNDAAYGYSVAEQLANYDGILAAAELENVPIWITTTQPRNLSIEKRQNLMDMRDSTWSRFGGKAVDFWTSLAQEDGAIDPAFDCGDGVHLNDLGHNILFERVVAAAVLDTVLAYGN